MELENSYSEYNNIGLERQTLFVFSCGVLVTNLLSWSFTWIINKSLETKKQDSSMKGGNMLRNGESLILGKQDEILGAGKSY